MKLCRYLLTLIAFLFALSSSQAQTAPAAYLKKKTEYYDAKGKKLPSADGADHRVETTYKDSVIATIRSFYPSGKLKSIRAYGHLRLKILNGATTTWYESGQMRTKEDFLAGKRHGELLVYYPDGTLRRRDQFARDVHTAGECFGPEGQPVDYFQYLQKPVYPDGTGDEAAIARAVTSKGIYPEAVTLLNMDARILVHFTVNEQGRVENVHAADWKPTRTYPQHIIDGFRRLQTEAEWNVKQLKPFKPALLDGVPVPFSYTLPISFRVE